MHKLPFDIGVLHQNTEQDGDTFMLRFNDISLEKQESFIRTIKQHSSIRKRVNNTMMHKYLLHLALTRAECRVLRMATASAYVSAEEMEWYAEGKNGEEQKQIPAGEHDADLATTAQKDLIIKLGGAVNDKLTQKMAKEEIAILS